MHPSVKPQDLLADIGNQISTGWNTVARLQELMHELRSEDDYYNEEQDLTDKQFGADLSRLYISICAQLEVLGFQSLLSQFKDEYSKVPEKKITELDFIPFIGEMHSETLALFGRYHATLSALLGKDTQKQLDDERKLILEGILINTPKIVRDRGIEPANEAEVRKCVYDLLIHVFPDAVRESSIIQNTKTYKPDLGVKSLRAAIEYKFADTAEEVKKAIGGLYEDMRGYCGSEDWKHSTPLST